MNTGLRRGEVLKLRWGSVDFSRRLLTVEGRNAKSRQTRHVPLNDGAVSVLRNWREQHGTGARIFDVATGFQAAWEKILRRAEISNFRWHDLRHHFASRLVQHGVPLNTVRDLLGHSTVGMSLRYAHLAPDQRREAVAKLNERPLLTLTMRLQWEGLSGGEPLPCCALSGRWGYRTVPPNVRIGNRRFWRALISAARECLDFWSRSNGAILELPCAYGDSAVEGSVRITLIGLVEREGLEPSTRHYERLSRPSI